MQEITRDYNSYKVTFNDLQQKILNAQQAENMERHQQSEQFEVLDPAKLPEKPFQPVKIRFIALGVILGLAIGGCITFLLEFKNNVFYQAHDLESYVDLPVLVSIPAVDPSQKTLTLLRFPWGKYTTRSKRRKK